MASVPEWSALQWESRAWRPTIPADLVSRRVREAHRGRYRAALVPSIAQVMPDLPTDVLTEADEATREITRFEAGFGAAGLPLTALMLRSESASSSQIERLTSGAKAIALAGIGQRAGVNAELVIANVRAMTAAVDLADRLDSAAILAMHRALLGAGDAENAGRWRREQVWIGGTTYGPHQAEFVPPHHDHVPELIDDLVRFAARDDLPVLVHVALAHAQFETIHPFTDGNGRTGRALMHAMLRARGATPDATVPLSAGLLADTDAYFDALTAYRAGDPGAIVRRVAAAALEAVVNARVLVEDLQAVRRRWARTVRARSDSILWRIADLLLAQPVIDAPTVLAELGGTSANTHRALRRLADAGVIEEFSGRKRARLWQASEVIAAMDDFAARATRRRS